MLRLTFLEDNKAFLGTVYK